MPVGKNRSSLPSKAMVWVQLAILPHGWRSRDLGVSNNGKRRCWRPPCSQTLLCKAHTQRLGAGRVTPISAKRENAATETLGIHRVNISPHSSFRVCY